MEKRVIITWFCNLNIFHLRGIRCDFLGLNACNFDEGATAPVAAQLRAKLF